MPFLTTFRATLALAIMTKEIAYLAGFLILPEEMQEAQTVTRLTDPFGCVARTFFRFGFHRLFDALWAWLTLLPNIGFFPHNSHTFAISIPS